MANFAYTNSGLIQTVTIGNIIDSAHFSYVDVTLGAGKLGAYTTTETKLTKADLSNNKFGWSMDNNLPSSKLYTYTIYVKPTWYGASNTYTEGNKKAVNFYAYQNNDINAVKFEHEIIWTTVSDTSLGTGGSVKFSYTTTNDITLSYDPSTTYTLNAGSTGAELSGNTVTAGTTSGSISITATANDPVQKTATAGISIVNPKLTTGLTYIQPGGTTTYALSDALNDTDITWSITNATATGTAQDTGSIIATGSDGQTIVITALHGTGGVYGTRKYTIYIVAASNISIPTNANTGDTVAFSLVISGVQLSGQGSVADGHAMTTDEIAAAWTVSGMTILSCTWDATNKTWNGVAHIGTTVGECTIKGNYEGGTSTTTATSNAQDITLTLD